MIYISHRGNINGPSKDLENNPDYIRIAIENGYMAEIDVWKRKNTFLLGHDNPTYVIDEKFLRKNVICHAKNLEALEYLLNNNIHCFWHQEDNYTLTSKGIIWAYPKMKLNNTGIVALNECIDEDIINTYKDCTGICSDYIEHVKRLINK